MFELMDKKISDLYSECDTLQDRLDSAKFWLKTMMEDLEKGDQYLVNFKLEKLCSALDVQKKGELYAV